MTDITKVFRSIIAPVLALAVMLLTLFVYLSPAAIFQTQVALMIISPGRPVPSPTNTTIVDGPTIRMGMIGSCAQSNNSAHVYCTTPSITPKYDFSALPGNTTNFLQPPTVTSPVWIAVALGFWSLFFVIFTFLTNHEHLGKTLCNLLDKPVVARAAAWFAVLGYIIGFTAFLVNRMWFGKAVTDFNMEIMTQGNDGPQIQANLSNGFTLLWVAYAIGPVPMVCVLMNVHYAKK